MNRENSFYLAFSLAPGIGPKRFAALLTFFQTAERAWNAKEEELREAGIGEETFKKFDAFRKEFNIEKYLKELEAKQAQFIPVAGPAYPSLLKQISDPPIGLFIKGRTSSLAGLNPVIAVVGNRKMTSYGREVTEKLVSELATYDFTIVSGLALGIDATAHKTTLENKGRTIAVLGCGVDCCYPRENEHLYKEILENHGTIISEYPLGQEPNRGTFPARNRIIAGISQAVLVTEAGADSGSLITAKEARSINRPVFAVPGPITSKQSVGTTYLLKNGAKLVVSAEDILKELNIKTFAKQKVLDIDRTDLSAEEKQILKILESEAVSFDDVVKKLNVPAVKLSVLISGLELKGYISVQKGLLTICSSTFSALKK